MINVNVGGPIQADCRYKTKVLKGNLSFESQVTDVNTKYIVKWDFSLNQDITMPEYCIIEFDGGSINGNGHKIYGVDTVMIYNQLLSEILFNVDLEGTWIHKNGGYYPDNEDITAIDGSILKFANKAYDAAAFSGLGRKYLRKNIVDVYDDNIWAVKIINGVVYVLYTWRNVWYVPYNYKNGKGIILRNTVVEEIDGYNIEDVKTLFPDVQYLEYTNEGSIAITLPNGSSITQSALDATTKYPFDSITTTKSNILNQEEISESNTIYIIQYDYDLYDKTITIPAGCMLVFEGGSLKGGTLVGNNTYLVYNREKESVFIDLVMDGTFIETDVDKDLVNKLSDISNDKSYTPSQFSGLGRVNLAKNIQTIGGVEKNILTQDMFYKGMPGNRVPNTNTIFVIQYDYDLNDANGENPITIPEGCVLKFDGGSLKNGEIICQNTILEGNVSIDVISGSIVGEFKSSFSTHSCDYDKLNMLLSLNVDNLVLDEDYSLDSYDGVIQSSLKKVVGNNITISVGCDIVNSNVLGLLLSFNNYPTEISGIKFDFNGHAVRHAIVIQNTAETFYLGDISISNVDNRLENVSTDDHYYCNCINIAPSNNSVVNISNIKVDNLKIWGVGEVGDANGSQYGIYCYCQTNVVEVNIKSCTFDNIEDYTYDDNSRTIHDSAGLYVSKNINVFETSFNIEGIAGTAFGKRLIKTNGGNVKISNVTGYQGNVDVYPLSLISLNSGDSVNPNNKAVYVSNITYTGDSDYVVALLGSGDLNNICIFSKSRNHAIIAAGEKGITVSNVYVNGFRPLVYSTDSNLSCTFNNVTFEYNKDDVPETETISNFYIATGYGLQLFVNNLNLYGGGYGYMNFIQGNSFAGQRSIQINGLYYDAYVFGNGVNLATLIEVGSESYGLNLEINNAIVKIQGNNYRRVFDCPKNSILSIKNTEISVDNNSIQTNSIPYGTFTLGDSNKLYLSNTKVSYSGSWNGGVCSLYLNDGRTDTTKFNKDSVFICNCNLNEVKPAVGSKTGISFGQTATKIAWSGGDVVSVDRLPTGLGINEYGFKTKLASWSGYGRDKTITWDGFRYVYNIDNVGSTRPAATDVYVGFQFFDTSLSPARPIYVSAISGDTVTWVDATGAVVS